MLLLRPLAAPYAAAILLSPLTATAQTAHPNGPVILEISAGGAGARTTIHYDLGMLGQLPQHEVSTETPWTAGVTVFEGVLLRDLLASSQTEGTRLIAHALNDYSVEIPMADVQQYDVVLATRMNGQFLTIRDRGPLWVIYPWSAEKELQNELYYSRSIWQLRAIEIR